VIPLRPILRLASRLLRRVRLTVRVRLGGRVRRWVRGAEEGR
jgi:hypothetical protein